MSDVGFFFLLLCLTADVLITGSFYPIAYFAVAILHELGHLIVLKHMKIPTRSIRFVGFGIRIENAVNLSYTQEITMAVAGPALNIISALVFGLLFCKARNMFILHLCFANLFYALLNLLPIAPLDGHRILKSIIMLRARTENADFIMMVVSIAVSLLLLLGLIWLMANGIYNFSLYFILIVLFLSQIAEIILK